MVTNEIQIFKNNEFGEIRTIIDKNGNPFFCLKDICDILEIGNPSQVKTRLDSQYLIENEVYINTGFGERLTKMTFVNEDGLYDCILDSNKPNARKIRKWVTSDILPSIRKTGMYLTDDIYNLMMKEPEKIGEMLIEYGKAKKENESLKLDNKIKEQQILELQPKALYYDLILQCKELLSVTAIAKDYGKSAQEFNKILHDLGVQYKQSGLWFLYQKYAIYGYTQTKVNPYTKTDGTIDSKTHMYWTQKGRIFLYSLLKENGILPNIEKEEGEVA